MHGQQTAQTAVALSHAFLIVAAELCRSDAETARFVLHLQPDEVDWLARTTPMDLERLKTLPVALVHPHPCSRQALAATRIDQLLRPVQAALEAHLGADQ